MEKFVHSNINKWIFFPEITDKDRFVIKNALYSSNLKENRSHYFNGRWENIYISHDLIPNIEKILFHAGLIGKNIYGKTVIVDIMIKVTIIPNCAKRIQGLLRPIFMNVNESINGPQNSLKVQGKYAMAVSCPD